MELIKNKKVKTSAAAEAAEKSDLHAAMQGMAIPAPNVLAATVVTKLAGPSVAAVHTTIPEAEIPAAAEVTPNYSSAAIGSGMIASSLKRVTNLASIRSQWRWLYMIKAP